MGLYSRAWGQFFKILNPDGKIIFLLPFANSFLLLLFVFKFISSIKKDSMSDKNAIANWPDGKIFLVISLFYYPLAQLFCLQSLCSLISVFRTYQLKVGIKLPQ